MPTKGWPRGSVLGGWGGAARGGSAGVAFAVGRGLAAVRVDIVEEAFSRSRSRSREPACQLGAETPRTKPGRRWSDAGRVCRAPAGVGSSAVRRSPAGRAWGSVGPRVERFTAGGVGRGPGPRNRVSRAGIAERPPRSQSTKSMPQSGQSATGRGKWARSGPSTSRTEPAQ